MKIIRLLFAMTIVWFMMNSPVFSQYQYFQYGSLNYGSVDVGDWTELNTAGPHDFSVSADNSTIEVYLNTRFEIQNLTGTGVSFQVRIDGVTTPDYDNRGSILTPNTDKFESIFAVFTNVPSGAHTVSIWAKAYGGSATGVMVDPSGWEGSLIVKVPLAATAVNPVNPPVQEGYKLQQNYPNPFNPSTTIRYSVQKASTVELKVYNAVGQLVNTLVDDYKPAGEYSVVWDGKDNFGRVVSSGAYYYQIKVGDFISSKKMVYIK